MHDAEIDGGIARAPSGRLGLKASEETQDFFIFLSSRAHLDKN